MTVQSLSFRSDGLRLYGVLHLPERSLPPVIVGSHGLLGNRKSAKQVALADACTNAGMAFFRFDHRGCGDSDPPPTGEDVLTGRISDLIHAVAFATGLNETGSCFGLFGSSMGGAAALGAAPVLTPTAVVTWAAPLTSDGLNAASPDAALPPGWQLSRFDFSDRLSSICNILIFHGKNDDVVPVANATAIHAGAAEPKSLMLLEDEDHRMQSTDHQEMFVYRSVAWYREHLSAC